MFYLPAKTVAKMPKERNLQALISISNKAEEVSTTILFLQQIKNEK